MSRTVLTAIVIVLLTVAALAGLLFAQPFLLAGDLVDWAFGAPPRWTQVESVRHDPLTQETSQGEKPAETLSLLASHWARSPQLARNVLIGNSQMLAVSLATGEPAPTAPETTYTDQIASRYSGKANFYRLAAPGMSYSEALWYTLYLTLNPELKPNTILLQLNYQSFWNGGIRYGMLSLLNDAPFRQAVERLAASNEPHGDVFAEALETFRASIRKTPAATAPASLGDRMERAARAAFDQVESFRHRRGQKDAFVEFLYKLRVYILNIRPTTARTITGTRLIRSQASIREIARLCQSNGIRLVLFHAPVNPLVHLYRTEEDRRTYREFAAQIAQQPGVTLYDLEDAVPAEQWGKWMNGPDPLHLSRAGHRNVAARIVSALDQTAN